MLPCTVTGTPRSVLVSLPPLKVCSTTPQAPPGLAGSTGWARNSKLRSGAVDGSPDCTSNRGWATEAMGPCVVKLTASASPCTRAEAVTRSMPAGSVSLPAAEGSTLRSPTGSWQV